MEKSTKIRKIPWTHIVTWVSILITSISIWATLRSIRSDITRVEKRILANDFKITSPSNGDSVDMNVYIQGEIGRAHV